MTQTRRLAAILAADVVGYSRLMGAHEEGTLERLKGLRHELVDPKITQHHGRIFKTTGDGILIEFSSVVDALRCATEVQKSMAERNVDLPPETRIEFRIGIHQGDIVVDDGDIFGDGVNVAARLEGLADPGGICVSARVQEDVAGRLDVTFDDIGEQNLKNIVRPVHVYRVRLATAESAANVTPTESGLSLPLPEKPSIAVLPFANMSGDPEQEYFADGMVEEIITALSHIRWLFVIARTSTFCYKAQAVDVKQVGLELGVRYVLEGSVRKAGSRVRITAQLIDGLSGTHLWADRFDGSLEDVFDLQDKVASSVAGVIEPTLQAAETIRLAHRPTDDPTAYDLYLRAYEMVFSSGALLPDALHLMEQAIERDPDYGPALGWAAVCHERMVYDGRSKTPDTDLQKAKDLARRALQVAGDDPGVIANASTVLAVLGEDLTAMTALMDHALMLNPNFARGWYLSAGLRLAAGDLDRAIEHAQIAMRLAPRGRIGAVHTVLGCAYFVSGRFSEATSTLLLAIEQAPNFPSPYRYLAACYAHMGRLDQAREIIRRLRAITAVVMPPIVYLRKSEHRELLLSGLRLAAGETA